MTSDDIKAIRIQVLGEFPHLSFEAQEAIARSRIAILQGTNTSKLIKADFGENAGKNYKDDLFED